MTITGSCHCGESAFRIEGEIPAQLTLCTCSFCSKRGVLWAYYAPTQFQLTTPAADDAIYRWNTKLGAHHFCPVCGCGTFTDSPAFEPDETGTSAPDALASTPACSTTSPPLMRQSW